MASELPYIILAPSVNYVPFSVAISLVFCNIHLYISICIECTACAMYEYYLCGWLWHRHRCAVKVVDAV